MFGNISINQCFLGWFGNTAFKGKSVMFILDICHIVRCHQRLQTILCGSNEPEAQQVIQKVGRLNCGGELRLNRISGVDVTRVVFAPGSRLIAWEVSGAVNVTPTTFIMWCWGKKVSAPWWLQCFLSNKILGICSRSGGGSVWLGVGSHRPSVGTSLLWNLISPVSLSGIQRPCQELTNANAICPLVVQPRSQSRSLLLTAAPRSCIDRVAGTENTSRCRRT